MAGAATTIRSRLCAAARHCGGADGLYLKKPVEILVKRIATGRFLVRVGPKRDPIVGEVGDWLVQYSPEKRSIISDAVFRASYALVDGRLRTTE